MRRYPKWIVLDDIADPISISIFLDLFRERSDIIHAHHYMHFTTFVACVIAKLTRTPVLFTHHGYRSRGRRFLRMKEKLIGGANMRMADRVLAPSRSAKQEILDLGVDEGKVLVAYLTVFLGRSDNFKALL